MPKHNKKKTVDNVARSLTLGIKSAKKRVGTGDIAKMRKRRSFRGTQKQKVAAMQRAGFARHIASLKTRAQKMRAKKKFLKEISQTESRRQKEIAANKKRGPATPLHPPSREPGNAWSGGGGRRRSND